MWGVPRPADAGGGGPGSLYTTNWEGGGRCPSSVPQRPPPKARTHLPLLHHVTFGPSPALTCPGEPESAGARDAPASGGGRREGAPERAGVDLPPTLGGTWTAPPPGHSWTGAPHR